ncbi:hypothetical protein QBC34DRAFT_472741 [Podospora aff. communis PSN243]|uniref:Heterokaryon incompatibility domain-containing protein n=1 Tax=Podospora aff. communis PSN243 TaxID=3040156 RepID=A0AAV9GAS1_9PEZI|nr:hypothetical protein QBC34DRAFT_472741 [Podospora aff. communis PSN243]
MSEPNYVDSQKPSKQHLAALKALRSYIRQQTSLTDKGVKYDLISDAWYRPNANVGEVTIWEVLSSDGSTLAILTVNHDPATSPETPVTQVRIEEWSLNGVQSPLLTRQQAKSYSHVISQSLRHRMGHIVVDALTAEQEEERAGQSIQMTKDIASFLSSGNPTMACFSASLPGNYWEELTVRDNFVVLARRRAPRRQRLGADAQLEDSESGISDLFDSSSEVGASTELSFSDNDAVGGSESEDGFRASDLELDQGDASLSPVAYSEDGSTSAIDYEGLDHSDGESLHSLHLDSESDAEEEVDDSDEDIPNGPHTGALETCNKCRCETICLLHCHICHGQPFSLCKSCWESGAWCEDEKHEMADCPHPACPTAKKMTIKDPGTELELLVFDQTSNLAAPAYRFTQDRGLLTPMSPPALHPTAPLLAWFLGGNQIMFANFETGCHVFYRDPGWYHEILPSAPHTPDCLGFTLKFSDCGRMLRTLALVAPANMADACKGGILAGVVLMSYTLSADLRCEERNPVSQRAVSHCLTRLDMDSWATRFSVTWRQDHAYVCLGQHEMRVLRFNLAQTANPGLGSLQPGPVSALAVKDTLPASAIARTAYFIPGIIGSTVVFGARQPPRTAAPFSVSFAAESTGQWVSAVSPQDPPNPGEFPHLRDCEAETLEKVLVLGNARVRLLPVAGKGKDAELQYKSGDGVLTVRLGESPERFEFTIIPRGSRHPTSLAGHSVIDAPRAANPGEKVMATRLTRNQGRDPWISLTNVVDEAELYSDDEGQDSRVRDLKEYNPDHVLSTVRATVYAPPSSIEKGAYWRSSNSTADDEMKQESEATLPSELCSRCSSLGLKPSDFVDVHAEEEVIDLSKRAHGAHHSFMCDVCQTKFEAPCVSYRCKCKNGNWDACPDCYFGNKAFHDSHHLVRKTLFEIGYHDRPIAKVDTAVSSPPARWDGRLGTLEEVKGRESCPLCRLAVRSLQEARKRLSARSGDRLIPRSMPGEERRDLLTDDPTKAAPDSAGVLATDQAVDSDDETETEDEVDDQVVLSWHGYGWNRERWHLQGRYLVAEKGKDKGRPLALLSECHPFSPFTSQRLSSGIPITLLRSWLRQCEEFHGWDCQGDSSRLPDLALVNFRVIDVVDHCLTKVSFRSRFVALSYVWGQGKQYLALKSNVHLLEQTGYLETIASQLPKTVTDAMEFTRQMGERYLWVDALCIVQDDPESVFSLIDKMDLIYGISTFTIIAAAGDGSGSGLPGVKLTPRVAEQHIEQITPEVQLALLPDLEAKMEKTIYETRAWTFQEMLLSRRRFIFLEGMAYFQCERRTCREDFCPRKPDVVTSLLQGADTSTSAASYFGNRAGRFYGPGETWERLVQAYTRRSLSVQSDILKGFHGLQTQLGQQKNMHFIAGMPIEHLDSALLWAPKRQATRRKDFPSFSWAGWTSQPILSSATSVTPHPFVFFAMIDYRPWYTHETYIEWHGANEHGQLSTLLRSGDHPAYTWLSSNSPLPLRSKRSKLPKTDLSGRPLVPSKAPQNSVMPISGLPNPRRLLPRPNTLTKPQPPAQPHLSFAALVSDHIFIDEYDLTSQPPTGPDPSIFRFFNIRCKRHGQIYGQVIVTDSLETELGASAEELPAEVTVVVLANSMLKMDLDVLGTDRGVCKGGAEGSVGGGVKGGEERKGGADEKGGEDKGGESKEGEEWHYVLVVKRRGEGVVERLGVGVLASDVYLCGEGLRWEWVYLV